MNRTLAVLAALLLGATGLTACAAESPASPPKEAPAIQSSTDADPEDADEPAAPEGKASVMPPGARPASAEFPFPVPEDWAENWPFTEEKIGKEMGMAGSFVYPGDAASAAEEYKQLLQQAGFEIHPNPLAEQVNQAAFIAEGDVNGVRYSGTLDFDTDAEGTQSVSINLQKD